MIQALYPDNANHSEIQIFKENIARIKENQEFELAIRLSLGEIVEVDSPLPLLED